MCTGAYALTRAGILDGRRFALHWENIRSFSELFPRLRPVSQVYCLDDRIVTCAGGVAAADLLLRLIDDHLGAELSQVVVNMSLMTRRRDAEDEQVTSLTSRLGSRNPHLLKAVHFFEALSGRTALSRKMRLACRRVVETDQTVVSRQAGGDAEQIPFGTATLAWACLAF